MTADPDFLGLVHRQPATVRDGLLVHARCLARHGHALLLPRQLAYYRNKPQGAADASFVCGVSGENQLPAVNFCQDMRAWRAELQRAGIPIARGASFSGKAHADYLRFAQKIGYPVTLQPVIRNSLSDEVVAGIDTPNALKHYFIQSRRLEDKAAQIQGWTPYSMTRLSDDAMDDDGMRLLPPSVRYMVQKQVKGKRLRLLCLQGKLFHAYDCGADGALLAPLQPAPELQDLADSVLEAIQGIRHLRIEVMQPSGPGSGTEPEDADAPRHVVVDLSENLKLHELSRFDDHAFDTVLEQVCGGAPQPALAASPASHLVISGISSVEQLEADLADLAGALGFEHRIEAADPVTGRVEVSLESAPTTAAAAAWVYINGPDARQTPTSIKQSLEQH